MDCIMPLPCPSPTLRADLKLMSIQLMTPSNNLILCMPFSFHLQSFQGWGSFPRNQFCTLGDQIIGVSASTSVLPMNIQDWYTLGLTVLISSQSQGLLSLLQHHSSKTLILWRSAFFMVQLSRPYTTTGKTITLTRWIFVGKIMFLLFNILSRFHGCSLHLQWFWSWRK